MVKELTLPALVREMNRSDFLGVFDHRYSARSSPERKARERQHWVDGSHSRLVASAPLLLSGKGSFRIKPLTIDSNRPKGELMQWSSRAATSLGIAIQHQAPNLGHAGCAADKWTR